MNKSELIEVFSEKNEIKKQDAKIILESYLNIIVNELIKNHDISIAGFGRIMVKPQQERIARNPKTGQTVIIPQRRTIKFKPGKKLLELINNQVK